MNTSREKMMPLAHVAKAAADARKAGKRVVHCHGVFDLLHIGHVRHFEAARRLGDLLVVTVTPDRYVNKGPGRPVFSESLRAEAIAALGCVDYVALNESPTAVEPIKLIKPSFYVKGSDYKKQDEDVTGGIKKEEAAVKAAGGRLVYTDDITFSSSNLINRHLAGLSPEVGAFLERFKRRFSAAQLKGWVESARSLKVLVVGEAIVDEYRYCEAIGKSSKEPTLVVKKNEAEQFAGGILAVANNVAGFADKVGMVTFLGDRPSRRAVIDPRMRANVRPIYLTRKGAPTILKTRYVEAYHFAKLLEVYEIDDSLMEKGERARLHAVLRREVPKYDVVLVVDYGHGMIDDEAIDILCRKSKFLAVNTQSNAGNIGYHTIGRYGSADLACLAENELRMEARDRRGPLEPLVERLAKRLKHERLVVTRGKYGCLIYDGAFSAVPALAGHVKDRVGAGDAFLSVAALCAAQGAPLEAAGFLGNASGAQAVATVGHRASVDKVALLKHVEALLK